MPSALNGRHVHNHIPVLIFGALQLIIGSLLILLDIGELTVSAYPYTRHAVLGTLYFSGIWTGVLHIIAGVFGVVSAQNASHYAVPRNYRCHMMTSLIFSVVAFILVLILTPVAVAMYLVGTRYTEQQLAITMLLVHAVFFGILLCVNLSEVVLTSTSIQRCSAPVTAVVSGDDVPDHEAIASALLIHGP